MSGLDFGGLDFGGLGNPFKSLGDQLAKIAKNPGEYLGSIGKKIEHLPKDLQNAVSSIAGIDKVILGNMVAKTAKKMAEMQMQINNEAMLRQLVIDNVQIYKETFPDHSLEGCSTVIPTYIQSVVALPFLLADSNNPYGKFIMDNAKRIASEECSKSFQ